MTGPSKHHQQSKEVSLKANQLLSWNVFEGDSPSPDLTTRRQFDHTKKAGKTSFFQKGVRMFAIPSHPGHTSKAVAVRRLFFSVLFALGLGFGATRAALAGSYTFTTIDIPDVPGAIGNTMATSINNRGQIVLIKSVGSDHGYVFSNGSFWTFDVPDAQFGTIAQGINDRGQIVGAFPTFEPERENPLGFRSFLLSNGSFWTFDAPGSYNTQTTGINNLGQIVGNFLDASYNGHGFLLNNGSFQPVEFPGAPYSSVQGINDRGEIVGSYYDGFEYHAFLFSKGSFQTVDFPGASKTQATAINNRGQIIGVYDLGNQQHGFLLSQGSFQTVDFPGASLTSLSGINDRGEIVGSYIPATAIGVHGFLATPLR